mgnify:CR=1 FL=1
MVHGELAAAGARLRYVGRAGRPRARVHAHVGAFGAGGLPARAHTCVGTDCTLDNRLHYALAYKRHETAYHASRAMVAAHRRAQHQLPEFYGHARRAGDAPETAAEAQVVLESAWQCRAVERNIKRIAPGLAKLVDTNVVAHHVLDVQHELAAELVHRGVLTAAGAAEVCRDLDSDRGALKAARRRKKGANVDRHVDRVRGREMDTDEARLRMTNALRTNTTVSTNTSTTGGDTVTDESSEI